MYDQRTKRLKLVALLPVNQSSTGVMYCDKGKDNEILSKLHSSSNTQPNWHGPKPIGMGQNKRSFKASARVPFTTICTNLSSGLTSRVHSHAVKVPMTSTTNVSFSNNADVKTNNAKVPFSNDADAKTNNALSFRHTASSTFQLVVASVNNKFSKSSNKLTNASSFEDKSSSAFQLVVASVDWKSKAISNKPFRTKCLKSHKSSCASKVVHAKCLNSHESSCTSKVARAKCLNSHKSSCASLLVARAKCLNSHKSSCASLLAVHAKPVKSNKTQRMTPSLSLKFIGKSILEGAKFAPTTLQVFKLIVASAP
jgi:hypothetical protein